VLKCPFCQFVLMYANVCFLLVSYCILKYKYDITLCVCYKCVLGRCMYVSVSYPILLFCWRVGAWGIAYLHVACPEIQILLVQGCYWVVYWNFFYVSLRIFLTLCVECWCLSEGLCGTGAVCVGLNAFSVCMFVRIQFETYYFLSE
jgi:hypothetical protein